MEYYEDYSGQIFISNNGEILLPYDLEYGDYVIEIIEVDSDYFKEEMKVKFSINEESDFYYKGDMYILDVWIFFESYTYDLIVKKRGEIFEVIDNNFIYSWDKLSFVSFELYASEAIVTKDKYRHYEKSEVVDILITDDSGIVRFSNLEKGEYCLKEIEVDSKYLLNEEKYCFYLDSDKEIEVDNYLKKGNLVVSVLDYYNREGISSIELEIFDGNDNLLGIFLTDDLGQINLKDIPLGEYRVFVKNVVDDYKTVDSMIDISLETIASTEKVVIFLEKEGKVILVPNTFHNESRVRYIGLFIVFLIGSILVAKNNDK